MIITNLEDVRELARIYICEYDRAGAFDSEAIEGIADRAAREWRETHSYGPVDDEDVKALYEITERVTHEVIAETGAA